MNASKELNGPKAEFTGNKEEFLEKSVKLYIWVKFVHTHKDLRKCVKLVKKMNGI